MAGLELFVITEFDCTYHLFSHFLAKENGINSTFEMLVKLTSNIALYLELEASSKLFLELE